MQQQTQKPVRYYIVNKDDDQAVVRTVPVAVSAAAPPARHEAAVPSSVETEERAARRLRMARLVHAIRRGQGTR